MATRSFRRSGLQGDPQMQTQAQAAQAAQGRRAMAMAATPNAGPVPRTANQPRNWYQGYQPYQGYDAQREALAAAAAARAPILTEQEAAQGAPYPTEVTAMKRGGVVRGRGDGIAQRGLTKGKIR